MKGLLRVFLAPYDKASRNAYTLALYPFDIFRIPLDVSGFEMEWIHSVHLLLGNPLQAD